MDLERLIVRIEADAKPLQTALGTLEREADQSLSSIAQLGDRIGTSMINAAVKGENLASILRGLVQDIAAITLRQTVVNPLGDLLSGAIGSLFGRATGGSVSAATPYWVGERGPELFVPNSAGRIEPASGIAGSGTASNIAPVAVTVSIDARGADSGAADRLRSIASEIEARTFSAVYAAMERGGRFAKASGRRG